MIRCVSLSELFGVIWSTLFGVHFEYGPTCQSAGSRPQVGVGAVSHHPASLRQVTKAVVEAARESLVIGQV